MRLVCFAAVVTFIIASVFAQKYVEFEGQQVPFTDLSDTIGSYQDFVLSPCAQETSGTYKVEAWRFPRSFALKYVKEGTPAWASCTLYASYGGYPSQTAITSPDGTYRFKRAYGSTAEYLDEEPYWYLFAKQGTAKNTGSVKVSMVRSKSFTSGTEFTPCSGTTDGEVEVWKSTSVADTMRIVSTTVTGCNIYVGWGQVPLSSASAMTTATTAYAHDGATQAKNVFLYTVKSGNTASTVKVTATLKTATSLDSGDVFNPCTTAMEQAEYKVWKTSGKVAAYALQRKDIDDICRVYISTTITTTGTNIATADDTTYNRWTGYDDTGLTTFITAYRPSGATAVTDKDFKLTWTSVTALPSPFVPCKASEVENNGEYKVYKTSTAHMLKTTAAEAISGCTVYATAALTGEANAVDINDADVHYYMKTNYEDAVPWYIIVGRTSETANTKALTIEAITASSLAASGSYIPCQGATSGENKIWKVPATWMIKFAPASGFPDTCIVKHTYVAGTTTTLSATDDKWVIPTGKSAATVSFVLEEQTSAKTNNKAITMTGTATIPSVASGTAFKPCEAAGKVGQYNLRKYSPKDAVKYASSDTISGCSVYVDTTVSTSGALTLDDTPRYEITSGSDYDDYIVVEEWTTADTAQAKTFTITNIEAVAMPITTAFNPCDGDTANQLKVYKATDVIAMSVAVTTALSDTECKVYGAMTNRPSIDTADKLDTTSVGTEYDFATGESAPVTYYLVGQRVAANTKTITFTKEGKYTDLAPDDDSASMASIAMAVVALVCTLLLLQTALRK